MKEWNEGSHKRINESMKKLKRKKKNVQNLTYIERERGKKI